jgi:hypothetical protein
MKRGMASIDRFHRHVLQCSSCAFKENLKRIEEKISETKYIIRMSSWIFWKRFLEALFFVQANIQPSETKKKRYILEQDRPEQSGEELGTIIF